MAISRMVRIKERGDNHWSCNGEIPFNHPAGERFNIFLLQKMTDVFVEAWDCMDAFVPDIILQCPLLFLRNSDGVVYKWR